ncbi:MAG: hypothetical protein AAFU41_12860 [Pseudomonadota bacterium]
MSGALIVFSWNQVHAETINYSEPIKVALERCLDTHGGMVTTAEFADTSSWRLEPEAPFNTMFSSILTTSWDQGQSTETIDYAASAALLSLANSSEQPNHHGFAYEEAFLAVLDIDALGESSPNCIISGPAEVAVVLTSHLATTGAITKPNDDWFKVPLTNHDALLILNVHPDLAALSRTSPRLNGPEILTDWSVRFRPVSLMVRLSPAQEQK